LLGCFALCSPTVFAEDDRGNAKDAPPAATAEISAGERDETTGIITHTVRSPLQSSPTEIRVLLPAKFDRERTYPVVFVLPVEAGRENRYGDGLEEIRKQQLHERHSAVFVTPTFARLPWYADHSDAADLRQSSYFLEVVVPFVRKRYPVEDRPHLLGFSKSGWGAWSLLLRNPETFGRAVAWDAPLMMDRPDRYGMGEIFGSQENFERYQISRLLAQSGDALGKEPRLILLGYGNFREHHEQTHALLDKREIVHVYRDGPMRKHDWHSGWVAEAVADLLKAKSAD
jgi:hypothetical protein